ncbi:MAG: TIGR02300 family protein [Alphaproteobacteria bacterium]|nr:TIGR02300 family protein [Alphaproteobacteria bacterium]
MVKENWGKKHICPFCGAMFYDMKKEVVVCPKCKKNLTIDDEIEFIRKKKKTEVKPDDQIEDLGVNDEVVDLSESEMFFDMDNDEQNSVSKTNYYSDEEDDY